MKMLMNACNLEAARSKTPCTVFVNAVSKNDLSEYSIALPCRPCSYEYMACA